MTAFNARPLHDSHAFSYAGFATAHTALHTLPNIWQKDSTYAQHTTAFNFTFYDATAILCLVWFWQRRDVAWFKERVAITTCLPACRTATTDLHHTTKHCRLRVTYSYGVVPLAFAHPFFQRWHTRHTTPTCGNCHTHPPGLFCLFSLPLPTDFPLPSRRYY